jgi:hypothetical protein
MDMNEDMFWIVAQDRQAEMGEEAERLNRVAAAGSVSHPPRVARGSTLIRIARRLLGVEGYSVAGSDVAVAVTTRGRSTCGAARG